MHWTRSSSGCSLIQGIYARLTGGVHLPSIYRHCTRCSSGCSGMQGICAQMTGGLGLAVGLVVCRASMLDRMGGSTSSGGCSSMQGIYAQLTVGSICLLYICIVLDLVVGVALYKSSMLD